MNLEADVKPVVVSVGNGMLLEGFDKALEDKEIGKDYSIHLSVDDGFGPRNPQLIRMIPMRIFREKNMNPMPGMTLQMDNQIAKVISVSGGRVMVDFNNPLAGKELDYKFKILKKVEDDSEKVNALQDFFFKQRFEFSMEGKKVIFKDEKIKPLIDMMKDKLKEIGGFEFGFAEKKVKEEKSSKSEENLEKNSKADDIKQQ
jgi:FKBP-type peptidyl-prolyl cis-trans isomerase 2